MKSVTACVLLLGAVMGWRSLEAQSGAAPAGVTNTAHMGAAAAVDTYCATCHNGRLRSPSGPVLDLLDPAQTASRPDVWARAYRQLQAGAMPLVGSPRPDRATEAVMLGAIEEALGIGQTPAARPGREVASRLARLLWNSAPDAPLLSDARDGRLGDPAVLERHVKRMLADARASAFVARFFFPYFQLDKLAEADPDLKYFPDYDVSLRDALAKETELFVLSQLRDDRDPIELWSAGYTFLNARLARHYGVPGVSGSEFRRVAWRTPERAGLLGQGSVLMVTSRHQHGVDAAYTTPATRAKWVRLQFLGAPLPNGFPGAQPVKPELPIAPQTRTLAADPCANCHRNFFPIGYALENFDPIGRWRTHDQLGPVDTSGAFVDGSPTNGVVELRQVLLQRPEAFRTTITEQLLAYASTGSLAAKGGTPETLVQARRILRGLPGPRWSALIAAVVTS